MFIEMSKRKIKSAFLDVKKHSNKNNNSNNNNKKEQQQQQYCLYTCPPNPPESRLLLAKCEAAGVLAGR